MLPANLLCVHFASTYYSAMEEYEKKCGAVPPILIHSGTPAASNGASFLPPISPRPSVLNCGQPSYQVHWNGSTVQGHDQPAAIKSENVQVHSYMNSPMQSNQAGPTQHGLQHQLFANFSRLPAASHGPGVQHLQHPLSTASPLLSDIQHRSNQVPKKGKVKTEIRAGMHRLPPLNGYTSGSNLDIDDTLSPLIPPINSVSPYIGSGISEIPSFPSILASPTHLTRKRALSTSPLSDMLDIYALRSSSNSLVAAIYNNPMTPGESVPISNNSTIGHLIAQPNAPLQAMQFRVHQRKTSIEYNQNDDGTTNTTITNQITISKNRHRANFDAEATGSGAEPMELDTFNGHGAADMLKEEPLDPHVCLWEGCELNFADLEDLVQHIETSHIEKGKADEYICLWKSCVRSRKPFNARYKLLIHMRIHSGEKPNKCTVSSIRYMP